MRTPKTGESILDYFGFLLSYGRCAIVAFAMLACSLACAVFSEKPKEASPINDAVGQLVPHEFQQKVDEAQDVLDLPESKEANLSPAQWRELKLLLDALPSASQDMSDTFCWASERREVVLQYGDFVFTHYDKLSQQAKDDWQALKDASIKDGPKPSECLGMQQLFISRTALVSDVRAILAARQQYEAARSQFLQSMLQVDRLMPDLYASGLPRRTPKVGESPPADPSTSISEYFKAHGYTLYKPTVATLPKVGFTMEEVIQQLKDPPMSTGKTSADRAAE